MKQPAAGRHGHDPVQPRTQRRDGVGAHDLLHVETGPDLLQDGHACAEARGPGDQCRGVERARRGAHQYLERARRVLGQPVRHRAQDAHLVGGTRATARQHERLAILEEQVIGICIRSCHSATLADRVRTRD
jgi:hypothetical protein